MEIVHNFSQKRLSFADKLIAGISLITMEISFNSLRKILAVRSFFKTLTIFFVFLSITGSVFSQSAGDYRSATSGNWLTLSSWERYNGVSWLTPTSAQGYPGQNSGTGALTIRSGHIITIGTGGINTQQMGTLTIQSNAQLYLNGGNSTVIFAINTPTIAISSGGSMHFANKARLLLTTDAVVTLAIGAGSLVGGCSNNSEIYIGNTRFAACAGAPGDLFTFAQLMSMGGTLNAIPSSNSPICEAATINLTGTYAGAIGTAPVYSWSVTNPQSTVTVYNTQNVNISSAIPGTYTAELAVSTVL
jgi:hypothetical protein